MPRKKVNDNIIGVRWQDIRLRGEIIAVNRRIGGLEMVYTVWTLPPMVNRRIGGLEIAHLGEQAVLNVNRRIGGLEKF